MPISKTYPLPALTDVDDNLDPGDGEVLTWDGDQWKAKPPQVSPLPGLDEGDLVVGGPGGVPTALPPGNPTNRFRVKQGDAGATWDSAERINVRDLGAVGDGIVDDSGALLAALTAANATNGTVLIPPGTFGFSGELAIPDSVAITGVGGGTTSAASVLKALNAAAQVRFSGGRGGICGNLLIDGAGIATTPVRIDQCANRQFDSLWIQGGAAAGTSLLLQGTQNCTFHQLNLSHGQGDGLTFDSNATLAANNNAFFGGEIASFGGYQVRFRNSGGAATAPFDNVFYRAGIEDFTGDAEDSDGLVWCEAGFRNTFQKCFFSRPTTSAPYSLTKTSAGPLGLVFRDCLFTGNTTHVTALEVGSGGSVHLDGKNQFQNLLGVWLIDSAALVSEVGDYETSGVTTYFTGVGGATEVAKLKARSRSRIEHERPGAADETYRAFATGDAQVRFQQFVSGQMQWGPGNAAVDTILRRGAANLLELLAGDSFRAGGGLYSTAVAAKTSNYSATGSDYMLPVDATSGAVTITLPNTSGLTGVQLTVKRTSATNNVIVDGLGADTIDGAATKTITTQYGWVTVLCSGANAWLVVSQGGTVT